MAVLHAIIKVISSTSGLTLVPSPKEREARHWHFIYLFEIKHFVTFSLINNGLFLLSFSKGEGRYFMSLPIILSSTFSFVL
jgi:hypothetical protein